VSGSDRVEVIGTGSAPARPDLFVAQLGAEATGPDVATVLEAAELAVAAMAGAARAGGASDVDVRTTDVTVATNYAPTGPDGYRAAIGLGLTLHDLESAGTVLAEVVAAGGDASRVHAVSMAVADPHPALDAAREAAFADARHQAEQLAGLAGRALGDVRRVTPQQVFNTFARVAAVQEQAKPLAAVPIEAGATTLTVSLQVRFDLD
jgi:uncharacterized protein YggE